MSQQDAETFSTYIRGLFIEPFSVENLNHAEEMYYLGWNTKKVIAWFEDVRNAGYHLKK